MGFFASLFCVCLIVFVGLLFGLRLYVRFSPQFFLQHKETIPPVALYIGFLSGGIGLSALSFFPVSFLFVYALAGVTVLGLKASSFSEKWKKLLSFLLCLGVALNLSQWGHHPAFLSFVMALLWWGIWHLWLLFDRFPFVSFLTSSAWAIALFSVGLIMQTVPVFLLIPLSLIGSGVMALSYFKLSQRKTNLGPLTASLVGFVWGGVWAYFLVTGAFFQVLTAFGYYLFEGITLGIAFYFHRPIQTYLERMLAFPQLASKAVGVIFSHLLILSFLAAMTLHIKGMFVPVLIFSLAVVLVDLSLRLNALLNPQPTWRELLKNTKDSLFLAAQQMKKKEKVTFEKKQKPRKKRKTKR